MKDLPSNGGPSATGQRLRSFVPELSVALWLLWRKSGVMETCADIKVPEGDAAPSPSKSRPDVG